LFSSVTAIRGSNYYNCYDNAYYKASLIKVVYIVVKDTVFNLEIIYKGKLLTNNL